MPELPEVETTRRGIEPYLVGKRVTGVVIRQRSLRWPVTKGLSGKITGKKIEHISRRGKYLLLKIADGHLMIHLGMSGSLRVLPYGVPPEKHDHMDLQLNTKKILRFTDPRRFGAVLWYQGEPDKHKLLVNLGPEPLGEDFSAGYLFNQSRNKKIAIKNFIMNSNMVVGVGNIYANEALFLSGIRPSLPAGKISKQRCEKLVATIKQVLSRAIEAGGTTLKDFTSAEGKPGYFSQELTVYGRGDMPCVNCKKPLKEIRLGQRSTVYCTQCQK